MTLVIEDPVLEAGLSRRAQAAGLTVDAYVRHILSREVATFSLDEAQRRREREEAAAEIRALRQGVTLGPDLTIRGLIDEGRRF